MGTEYPVGGAQRRRARGESDEPPAFRLPTWDHEKGLQTTETPKPGLSPQHFSHHIACKPRPRGFCAAWKMRRVHRSRIKTAPKQVLCEGHGVTQGVKRQEVMTWRYTGDD